jgi:hypothetical protein
VAAGLSGFVERQQHGQFSKRSVVVAEGVGFGSPNRSPTGRQGIGFAGVLRKNARRWAVPCDAGASQGTQMSVWRSGGLKPCPRWRCGKA